MCLSTWYMCTSKYTNICCGQRRQGAKFINKCCFHVRRSRWSLRTTDKLPPVLSAMSSVIFLLIQVILHSVHLTATQQYIGVHFASEGDDVIIRCVISDVSFDGNKFYKVLWLWTPQNSDGKQEILNILKSNGKHTKTSISVNRQGLSDKVTLWAKDKVDYGIFSLVISQVQAEASGNYTCHVKTKNFTHDYITKLFITDGRKELKADFRQIQELGDVNVVLSCKPQRNLCTSHGVSWFFTPLDGKGIKKVIERYQSESGRTYRHWSIKDSFSIQNFKKGDFSLNITSIRREDLGIYKCFVYSQNVHVEITVEMLIQNDAQHTQAVEEKSVFVRVGDAVTLPCLFNRSLWEEGARMGWSRYRRNAHKIFQLHKDFPNKKSTLSASNNNMNITGLGVKEGDFPLFISPVRFDDYGRFTCFYRNFSNPKQTILVVELITAEVTSPKDPVLEGSGTTLMCRISDGSEVEVEWMRGKLSVGKGKEIKLSQTEITDGGQWTCIVSTMNKTRLTINHFINVYQGSRDGVKRSIFITPVKSNITLPCLNDRGTQWYNVKKLQSRKKDGEEQTNGKFTITEDFSLTISDVRPKDTGHYECRSDRVTFDISVIAVTAQVTPKNGVSEGTAVTLNCDLSHPVPGVTFGWRHETSDRDVTNQSSLTLSFAPEDAGTWMCVLYGESGRVITTTSQTITTGQGPQHCMIFIWIFVAYVLLLAIVSTLLIWCLLKKKGMNQKKPRNK